MYYRRYSCTTANAANAAVANFGTGMTVFKCITPTDLSYRNDSKCRRYSCTYIWYRNCGIQVYEPHVDASCRRRYSCTWI